MRVRPYQVKGKGRGHHGSYEPDEPQLWTKNWKGKGDGKERTKAPVQQQTRDYDTNAKDRNYKEKTQDGTIPLGSDVRTHIKQLQ
eukprot:2515184-Amphidinium_carterae.1